MIMQGVHTAHAMCMTCQFEHGRVTPHIMPCPYAMHSVSVHGCVATLNMRHGMFVHGRLTPYNMSRPIPGCVTYLCMGV